jgi:hypothetical protein
MSMALYFWRIYWSDHEQRGSVVRRNVRTHLVEKPVIPGIPEFVHIDYAPGCMPVIQRTVFERLEEMQGSEIEACKRFLLD